MVGRRSSHTKPSCEGSHSLVPRASLVESFVGEVLGSRGARIFSCRWCAEVVSICPSCDRGTVYCSEACSALGRRRSKRAAKKRHQESPTGRRGYARRQRDYRRRQLSRSTSPEDVTGHSSPISLLRALVAFVSTRVLPDPADERDAVPGFLHCCGCGKPVTVHRVTTLTGEDPG